MMDRDDRIDGVRRHDDRRVGEGGEAQCGRARAYSAEVDQHLAVHVLQRRCDVMHGGAQGGLHLLGGWMGHDHRHPAGSKLREFPEIVGGDAGACGAREFGETGTNRKVQSSREATTVRIRLDEKCVRSADAREVERERGGTGRAVQAAHSDDAHSDPLHPNETHLARCSDSRTDVDRAA